MIGLVIVTHGRLALEFVYAMEHVVGPQAAVVAVCIGPEDDMEQRRRDILKAVRQIPALWPTLGFFSDLIFTAAVVCKY